MQRFLPVLIALVLLLLSTVGCNLNQEVDFQKGLDAFEKKDYETAEADFQKGLDAYNREDYETALREFKPLAEQGLARAQGVLGAMYYDGKGVSQNDKTAMEWYRLAAEQGNSTAQYNLGLMYATGQGVIPDDVYAHMWGNLAASNGNENGGKLKDLVAKKLTPSLLAKSHDFARECVSKNYKGC